MVKQKVIKAEELLTNSKFSEYIQSFENVNDLILFTLKRPKASFDLKAFVDYLVKNQSIFHAVIKDKDADRLLFNYFSQPKKSSPNFENALASQFPDLFINAVRVTQAFLNEERHDQLMKISFPEKIIVHKKIWKLLYDKDKKLWNEISESVTELKNYTLTEVLIDTVLWIEGQIDNNKNDLEVISNMGAVYSFFIKLYISEYQTKEWNLDNDIAIKNLTEKLNSANTKQYKNITSDILNKIYDWIRFEHSMLSHYSFDLKIQVVEKNKTIYFEKSPFDFYKWELDGVRYQVNRLNYMLQGKDLVFLKKNNGELYIDNTKDYNTNKKLTTKFQNELFLNDLAIENLNYKNKQYKIIDVITPLINYSFSEQLQYETHITSPASINSLFINETADDLYQQFKKALPHLDNEMSNTLLNLFSYNIKEKSFDRFKLDYNVWEKPFIRVGNKLFCPTIFITQNDWFYTSAQAGLKNLNNKINRKELKRTATLMERNLGEKLKKKNWHVKVIDDNDANKINGDVDIIVKDDNKTIFIQLKRTYLKLNLKDAYYEYINSDRKAAQQLIDAEKSLNQKNDIYNLNNEPVKWIVTTSFENNLAEIDGCKKINYFNILEAISNPEVKTVSQLIDFIEKDKALRSKLKVLSEHATFKIDPQIHLTKPIYYIQPIPNYDKNINETNNKYNEAIEWKDKKKAIEYIHDYLLQNPDDFDATGALAGLYADIKDFKKSFEYFEKVLLLIPDDPYYGRNFAIALMEAGRYYEGLKRLLNLHKKYPFIYDIEYDFIKNFNNIKQFGSVFLSQSQIKNLENDWYRLNN